MRRNYRELWRRRIYRAFSKDLTRSILNLDFHFKEKNYFIVERKSEQSIGALGDVSKLPRGISSFSNSDPFSSFLYLSVGFVPRIHHKILPSQLSFSFHLLTKLSIERSQIFYDSGKNFRRKTFPRFFLMNLEKIIFAFVKRKRKFFRKNKIFTSLKRLTASSSSRFSTKKITRIALYCRGSLCVQKGFMNHRWKLKTIPKRHEIIFSSPSVFSSLASSTPTHSFQSKDLLILHT